MAVRTKPTPYRAQLRLTPLDRAKMDRLWEKLSEPFPSEGATKDRRPLRLDIVCDGRDECDEPDDLTKVGDHLSTLELTHYGSLRDGGVWVTIDRSNGGRTVIKSLDTSPHELHRAREVQNLLEPWQVRRGRGHLIYWGTAVLACVLLILVAISVFSPSTPWAVAITAGGLSVAVGALVEKMTTPFAYDVRDPSSKHHWVGWTIGALGVLATVVMGLLQLRK